MTSRRIFLQGTQVMNKMHRRTRREGVSLLELIMVITLMGILAAIGTARFGRSVYGNFGAQGEARTLSLAMLQAKRAAIRTGDNHRILLDSTTSATSYSVQRQVSGAWTTLEGPIALSEYVTISSNRAGLEFNFEGEAMFAYEVKCTGGGRDWQLDVVPITGTVTVTDITP